MKPKYLLAIDPGTRALGMALFEEGLLVTTQSIQASGSDRYVRTKGILKQVQEFLQSKSGFTPDSGELVVACEEPFLQGLSNHTMQRLLGGLELMFQAKISYIHPMSLKKALGHGSKDKLEVALAAGERLKTSNEQNQLAWLIEEYQEIDANAPRKDDKATWDRTDAVAIGVVYLEGCK